MSPECASGPLGAQKELVWSGGATPQSQRGLIAQPSVTYTLYDNHRTSEPISGEAKVSGVTRTGVMTYIPTILSHKRETLYCTLLMACT